MFISGVDARYVLLHIIATIIHDDTRNDCNRVFLGTGGSERQQNLIELSYTICDAT